MMSLHALAAPMRSGWARSATRPRRQAQLVLAVLAIALMADLSVLVTQYVHGGAYATRGFYESDWLVFYRAAERLRAGANPYRIADQFLNPPSFLLLMRGAVLLPYMVSRLLWSVASAAMLLIAAWYTVAAAGWRPTARERLVVALGILVYTPTVLLIPLAANSTAPVVLCYALALWLFTREREGWAGVALCVAVLIKPQLAVLTLPLLIYKRRWRAALAYCGGACSILALSAALLGLNTFRQFYAMERAASGWAGNAALWLRDIPGLHAAFLQAWPHSALAGPLAYLLGAVLVVALAWYWRGPWQPRSPRFCAGWAMLPLVDLLIVPYAHSDDLVLLIVPMLVLYALCASRGATCAARSWIAPTLTALYLGPVLVLFFRQHFMVPAMLVALCALWQMGRGV
jgi:hypothetical protein